MSAADVRILCDRHRGIGADGVIVLRRGGGTSDVAMDLFNADGQSAETSGNGLRCVAQAAVGAGLADPEGMVVLTAAGRRRVRYVPGEVSGVGSASVEMGAAEVEAVWSGYSAAGEREAAPPAWPQSLRAIRSVFELSELGARFSGGVEGGAVFYAVCRVLVGNPHLVLFCESLEGIDVAELGSCLDRATAGGTNVEVVSPAHGSSVPNRDLSMVVWERGVGQTLACGTGSCAVAAAGRAIGLSGDLVTVHNPGGPLTVRLSGGLREPDVVLSGPVQYVGSVEVDLDVLRSAFRGPSAPAIALA